MATAKKKAADAIEGKVGKDIIAGDPETAKALEEAGVKEGDVIAIAASDVPAELQSEIPPPPDRFAFEVSPRMVDHDVVIDVSRGGKHVGSLIQPVLMGMTGFYTGVHEMKGALALLFRAACDLGYAEGLAAATQPNPETM